MAGRVDNLKPWKPGESGNPGGRSRTKPLTEELQRLLDSEAPNAKGQTWVAVIAEALVKKARKGDVRAIAELANRIEGKARQSVEADVNVTQEIIERLQAGRRRVLEHMTTEEIEQKIGELEQQLSLRQTPADPKKSYR